MTEFQWKNFCDFKNSFKSTIEFWKTELEKNNLIGSLQNAQIEARKKSKTPEYPIENVLVYNRGLDEITQKDEIKLIVVGDNPGKDEQLNKNQKYLVGQAGKLGNNFFKNNKNLEIDFRKNIIILNKTPLHSAKTKDLFFITKENPKIASLFVETQKFMAQKTAFLQKELNKDSKCSFWLVGYGELKQKGLFTEYKNEIAEQYKNDEKNLKELLVFQHFSMNRFTIDLKNHFDESKNLEENLINLGTLHRKEIFGF